MQQVGEREEGRAGEGRGRLCRTSRATGKELGFAPQEGGSPGGLWAGEET